MNGARLYELWVAAHAEFQGSVDEWSQLDDYYREVWSFMAQLINMEYDE